jgi:hypothetical protein
MAVVVLQSITKTPFFDIVYLHSSRILTVPEILRYFNYISLGA